MKRSPFTDVFRSFNDSVDSILAEKIKKAIRDRKLYEEISKTVSQIEKRYEESEMTAHPAQELTNYMTKIYAENYSSKNNNPVFDFEKFCESEKARMLVGSFEKNNCYTNEEEIRILNTFGVLPGQNGLWHYDDATLEKIFDNREKEIVDLDPNRYPHAELQNIKLSDFASFVEKNLIPYMNPTDQTIYKRNLETLSSEKFIRRCHNETQKSKGKGVNVLLHETLERSLSPDERLNILNQKEEVTHETDERGNKKLRSSLSVSATEKRKYSSLATYKSGAEEGESELNRVLNEVDSRNGGALRRMSSDYKLRYQGKYVTIKEAAEKGKFLQDLEQVDSIQKDNLVKIEYDAKMEDIKDVIAFGKEQFTIIEKDLDPSNPNYKDALNRLLQLTKGDIYTLFPKEMEKLNEKLDTLSNHEKDKALADLKLVSNLYSKAKEKFVGDINNIPVQKLNSVIAYSRLICENATLEKKGLKFEEKKKEVQNEPQKQDAEAKLKEIRDSLVVDKNNRIKSLEEKGNSADVKIAVNAVTADYNNQISKVEKFISACIIETDLSAKETYSLVAADLKESADNIDNIIKHASPEELKGILETVEEANNLGIYEDTCNFITEEIKTFRSEDITYTDDGKFIVEERTQEDVLERTITEEN